MSRLLTPLVIAGCLLALVLACFASVLLFDEQFAFRDAAHFYYPLYQRVQQEWDAGRWPLWSPEENAGMPLLGNPTAAVLYPGKVVYLLPYAWGARLYVVLHTLLAFAGMLVLMRGWGTSWTGSALSGLAYAFGAPILFQYCNIVFLVGAAWVPWGFWAADRWLRQGRRRGLLELAVVLAMPTLGGDPQAAYVTGVCVAGYAVILAWASSDQPTRIGPKRLWWATAVLVLLLWVAATLALAHWLPSFRPRSMPPPVLPWMPWVPSVVLGFWGLVGLVGLVWSFGDPRVRALRGMVLGLIGAAGLAVALTAAQLLPVLEFTRQTVRASEDGPHDVYPFSLEVPRVAELLWPNVFGTMFGESNTQWLSALPPTHGVKTWVPSLYLGGVTLLLALGALGTRGGPPWRSWLSVVAVLSLLASFGEYGGPLFWARCLPELVEWVGPHDPMDTPPIRFDGHLRDGDGSVYWFLATLLPGFGSFRYPSKLLTFTCLALAGLAGWGWDRLTEGRLRRVNGLGLVLLVLSVGVLWASWASRAALEGWLEERLRDRGTSVLGPIDIPGAVDALLEGVGRGAVVLALVLVLVRVAPRAPLWAGAAALGLLTADLALANTRLIVTVPQREFETYPRLLAMIEAAERDRPDADGQPFRVHRMPLWNPIAWMQQAAPHRVFDLVRWERETLQPKYAIPYGLQYTHVQGTAELFDYEFFFSAFTVALDPHAARTLGLPPNERLIYYTRRGFDLWNTRYFILPMMVLNTEQRGVAALLPETEPIFPRPDSFDSPQEREDWTWHRDWQLLRNLDAFPRAWIVHRARILPPITGMRRADRAEVMEQLLYNDDGLWVSARRTPVDLRQTAWVETDDPQALAGFLPGTPRDPEETVTITRHEPQRVELVARLNRPGLVVLADIFYPGWTLTINGQPAPMLRVNRAMRCAAVPAGEHLLVYRYEPASFRRGGRITLGGLAALVVLAVVVARAPRAPRPTLAGTPQPGRLSRSNGHPEPAPDSDTPPPERS